MGSLINSNGRQIPVRQNGKVVAYITLPIREVPEKVTKKATPVRKTKGEKGTNQYKLKPTAATRLRDTLVTGFVIVICVAMGGMVFKGSPDISKMDNADAQEVIRVPEPTVVPTATQSATPNPTVTPTAEPKSAQYEKIDAEIKTVFGEHYKKAMLLLKGDGSKGACHENAGLDALAINHNTDEHSTTDYGVFQINDYWQGFRHDAKAKQFLLDPHINIQVAWNIYKSNGYSFGQWTCGRAYGI